MVQSSCFEDFSLEQNGKFSNPVRKMAPITPNILWHLIQYPGNIFGNEWRIFTVIRSLYIHLFFSMLRLDNMVPQSSGCFNPVVQLIWSRVSRLGQGVVLTAIHTNKDILSGMF